MIIIVIVIIAHGYLQLKNREGHPNPKNLVFEGE
jgi:hypothetical protein